MNNLEADKGKLLLQVQQVQAAVRQAQLRREKEQRLINRALASK